MAPETTSEVWIRLGSMRAISCLTSSVYSPVPMTQPQGVKPLTYDSLGSSRGRIILPLPDVVDVAFTRRVAPARQTRRRSARRGDR